MSTLDSKIALLQDEIKTKTIELEKARQQLLNAQKMEALGVLARGIAHDFNNILTTILGNAELASDNLKNADEETRKFVSEIIDSTKRGMELIRQIHTFSRNGQKKRLCFIEIASLTRETMQFLETVLPKTIKIEQKIEFEGSILADQAQIHQIFANLCINAFHAMEKNGGTLTIALSEKVNDGQNYLCLDVTDTGAGISPEIQEKIFDPYFTTKDSDKGTGLGLSIVQGIVLAMGGKIKVRSEIGKGTTFSVFLPLPETTN